LSHPERGQKVTLHIFRDMKPLCGAVAAFPVFALPADREECEECFRIKREEAMVRPCID
jgi:hypothetical protein